MSFHPDNFFDLIVHGVEWHSVLVAFSLGDGSLYSRRSRLHLPQEYVMRPVRYSINVTLDGCCDHCAIVPDEELHRHAAENIARSDAILLGRVTYEMMEAAWRAPARTGIRPDWMEPWMLPFARTIDAAKKYVVSGALERVDWNAELIRGIWGLRLGSLSRRRVRECAWGA